METSNKRELTPEQRDAAYLHLLGAAITGLAPLTNADDPWTAKQIADEASVIADHGLDLYVVMHSVHQDEEDDKS